MERPVRRKKLLRLAGFVFLTLVAIFVLAGLAAVRLVVFPTQDDVHASDAIVILGPVDDRRLAVADSLLEQHFSTTLAMATFGDEASASGCEQTPSDVTVICFTPDPPTTRGEATWLRDEAARRGWDSVIVVTVGSHIERARYIFETCLGGSVDVAVVGEPHFGSNWRYVAHDIAYQSSAYLKAVFVTPGCAD